jgi:IS5 family transposase
VLQTRRPRAVYSDKGYASNASKRAAEKAGVKWAVKEKAQPGRKLTARQRARNRRFGSVRAKVEHVFRVMKCQFGYRKVRYRGIAKNGVDPPINNTSRPIKDLCKVSAHLHQSSSCSEAFLL